MQIKQLKGNKIYFPKGTSRWVGLTHEPALKITITAGGGMGGSIWTRFVKPQTVTEGLNWVKTIDGDEICINANYIVEIEKVTVLTADYRCTNPNFNMRNTLCTLQVCTTVDPEEIQLIPDYKSMDEWTY